MESQGFGYLYIRIDVFTAICAGTAFMYMCMLRTLHTKVPHISVLDVVFTFS